MQISPIFVCYNFFWSQIRSHLAKFVFKYLYMRTKLPCGQTCQYGFQKGETKQNCVVKDKFLCQLDCLKEQQKNSKSKITMLIDDGPYERAKKFLLKSTRQCPSVRYKQSPESGGQ